jgi:5-methylcytosine-specific restriction endonuclease McrA
MPIVRHGYSKQPKRGGTTRAQRKVIAQVLAEEHLCWYCHQPTRIGDPLEAAHIIAYSLGGSDDRANLRAAHRSCNRAFGALPPAA